MIPKIIHYCWFGRKPMPRLARICIRSWKKYCPDYEFKLWNEENFDFSLYPYAKEAYEAGKYAFVTDVVRLYALYHEGGIYMDTDVELFKPVDSFLHHHAFSGFEAEDRVPTGIMASEKYGTWAKENLAYYDGKHFLTENGSPDTTTNVSIITAYMLNKGLILNNTYQDFEGLFTMYPKDFFCPKDFISQEMDITSNTVCIHHFNMSWLSETVRLEWKIRWFCNKWLPASMASECASFLIKSLHKLHSLLHKFIVVP